jgi:hypothetical protein
VRVTNEPLTQQDAEHLRLLSIFFYIVAGLQGLFACFPIIHFVMGGAMLVGGGVAGKGDETVPLMAMGGFFMVLAGALILLGWTLAGCVAFAGRSLAQRKRYVFCIVVAALEAVMCIPLGTILGVFAIMVLVRPQVKAAFGAS